MLSPKTVRIQSTQVGVTDRYLQRMEDYEDLKHLDDADRHLRRIGDKTVPDEESAKPGIVLSVKCDVILLLWRKRCLMPICGVIKIHYMYTLVW